MNKSIPLIVFIVICFIDFLGIYFEKQLVIYIVKPLLMVSLFWYYVINTKSLDKLFISGLFFSFLGDVFLLGKGELFFIVGLGFFLTAHIFYIFMVLKLIKKPSLLDVSIAAFPYLMVFIGLLNILYSGLGSMKIPVIVYATTISVFGMISLLLFLQKKTKTTLILVVGVLVFIASDAVLALNMFYKKQSFYPLLIMITYVIAQYLICRFVLLNSDKNK